MQQLLSSALNPPLEDISKSYQPTGSTTVPLDITFKGVQGWFGQGFPPEPKITLNLDLASKAVTPAPFPGNIGVSKIENDCVVFSPGSYSNPPKICYAVQAWARRNWRRIQQLGQQ